MNDFNNWNNFFVAAAGSSAALTGLVFVGVSISLSRILQIPKISGRAVDALAFLLLIMTISLLCLVPSQAAHALGMEILIPAIVAGSLVFYTDRGMLRSISSEWRNNQLANMIANQAIMLLYLIAAMMLVFGYDAGIYLLVPAFCLGFIKALVNAWVILIEIHR